MKLGSLFSGSGGFELGGMLAGITPVWAAEVEPFPIRVTTKRIPQMKHYGDVSKINGAEVEPVDIITFGSPCFPGDTLILTDKGYTPIKDVVVGDKVLTHKGVWQRVTAAGCKEGETVILKGNHYGLECTPNHPIYSTETYKDYKRNEHGKQANCHIILQDKREWTDAKDMKGRMWAIPKKAEPLPWDIPTVGNSKEKPMPQMNEDFWYLCGRWLGDGWVREDQRPGRPQGQRLATIIICDSKDKEDQLVRAVSKVVDRYSVERGLSCTKVKFNSRLLCDWLIRNFGKGALNKYIASWIFGIDPIYRKALLQGVLDSDGNRYKSGYNVATSSKKLAHSVRLLAEMDGRFTVSVHRSVCSKAKELQGRVIHQSTEQYQVRMILQDGAKRKHLSDDRHSWYRVRDVQRTGKAKTVYNLTVENDNSYVAEGIVVHNCQDMSVAGKRAGLDGARSGLFYEATRIIREMRDATNGRYPRWAVWENVPGAFSSNSGDDFKAVLEELISVARSERGTVANVVIPKPDKWDSAGLILGNGVALPCVYFVLAGIAWAESEDKQHE